MTGKMGLPSIVTNIGKGGFNGKYKLCFGHVEHEMPIGHQIGDAQKAIGNVKLEVRREVKVTLY